MEYDIFTLKKQCLTCGKIFYTRRRKKIYHNYVCGYNYRNNMNPIKNAAQIQRQKELNTSDAVLEKYINQPHLLPMEIKFLIPLGLKPEVYTQVERINENLYEHVFQNFAFHSTSINPTQIIQIIKK